MTKNYRCVKCKKEFLYCTEEGSEQGLYAHVRQEHPEGKKRVRMYVEVRVRGDWMTAYKENYLQDMGVIE